MQTIEEKLEAIVNYIEQAGLTFTEPFSLISATVVESSYWTGISKNTILVHINKTFKMKYGEKYVKAQRIAHEIAYGKKPNEERIWSTDVSKELQTNEPEECNNGKGKCKPKKTTTVLGSEFREYTGLNTKENQPLYNACVYWYKEHEELPWENKDRWKIICERYGFEDKKLEGKEV